MSCNKVVWRNVVFPFGKTVTDRISEQKSHLPVKVTTINKRLCLQNKGVASQPQETGRDQLIVPACPCVSVMEEENCIYNRQKKS